MSKKKSDFFWASYADLMTSLFFIMLVLFVLTVTLMKQKQEATEEQLRKVKELQSAVRELPDQYFAFDSIYKRFTLKTAIQFEHGSSSIHHRYRADLMGVGKSIHELINRLKNDVQFKDMDIRYLIIIEGMASRDLYAYNYELSYLRALSLYNFWQENGIVFDKDICDIQIAGSGTGGIGRDPKNERNNQRFLIQIIPKIGRID